MGFYQDLIVPHLVNLSMRKRELGPYREKVTSSAQGRVLDVGIGSGMNLAFYPPNVSEVVGLEPAPRLLNMAREAANRCRLRVTLLAASAEAIPVDTNSVDTVVMTWTLCSIPDVTRALSEMRRVLKPGGQLLFVEHGLAPEQNVRKWQDGLNPLWKRIAGGCNLNRAVPDLIQQAGFRIIEMETGYMKGPKPMTFLYRGCAG